MTELENSIKVLTEHTQHYVPTEDLEHLYAVIEAAEKVSKYETAKEDGRLVVLPCKVGQCVYTNHSMSGWYMRKSERPYLGRVVFVGLNAEDPYFNIILGEGKMLQYKFSDIGTTVFLTKEEAEKALKEMEGGDKT